MNATGTPAPKEVGNVGTPVKAASAEKMRQAILCMDMLSQEGGASISAIARLALLALETSVGQRSTVMIATALETIVARCDQMQDDINNEAEHVGCGYKGAPASFRRANAARTVFHQS